MPSQKGSFSPIRRWHAKLGKGEMFSLATGKACKQAGDLAVPAPAYMVAWITVTAVRESGGNENPPVR